ncbi:MAG: hypothetical protein IKB94_01030 [Clostridia bacterium]|nr:hypothetical protein [Clostridia bacterium]
MLKRFITNTLCSFLTLILMSLIFTFAGFSIIELFKSFAGVVMVLVFGALLFLGYFIGTKLHYAKGMGFVSIVLLPIIVFAVLFALSIVGVPVISMLIQYPAAVWGEAFNARVTDNSVIFYGVAFVHYLICSLSLFFGAYKKQESEL